LEYSWPGNVRELENAIERAMILSNSQKIDPDYLPPEIRGGIHSAKEFFSPDQLSVKKATRILEADLIRRALKKTGGNRSQAARILEISHPALLSKIREYGIEREAAP
jgi:two-component system response regulator AtoC